MFGTILLIVLGVLVVALVAPGIREGLRDKKLNGHSTNADSGYPGGD